MKYTDIQPIVEKIEAKEHEFKRLTQLKEVVKDRTATDGTVEVRIEDDLYNIDAKELEKLIDKDILTTDASTEFAELKTKVK